MLKRRMMFLAAMFGLLGLVACSLNPFRNSGDDQPVYVNAPFISGFSPEEIQRIVGMVSSGPGNLNLPIQVPATDTYRFEFKNELGATRLAVVFSYAQALEFPTYGLESTARVLLLDAKARTVNFAFDRAGYAKGIATASVVPVVQAMVPYFSDIEFLLRSNVNIGSVPAVISVVGEVAAGLPAPVPMTAATDFPATASIKLDLRPDFSALGPSTLLKLVFDDELRGFYLKVFGQGLSNSSLFSGNVKGYSSPSAVIRGNGPRGEVLKSSGRYEKSAGFASAAISMSLLFEPVSKTAGNDPFRIELGSDGTTLLTYSNGFKVTPVFSAEVDEVWFQFRTYDEEACSEISGDCSGSIRKRATVVFTIPSLADQILTELSGDLLRVGETLQNFRFPKGVGVKLPAVATYSVATLTAWVPGLTPPAALDQALIRKRFLEVVGPRYSALEQVEINNGAKPSDVPANPVIAFPDLAPVYSRGGTVKVLPLTGPGILSISSVQPASCLAGKMVPVAVTGWGFASGSTLQISKEGSNPIRAAGTVPDVRHLSATLDLTSADPGSWTLAIVSPGGRIATWTAPFVVMPMTTPPKVTSISPGLTIPDVILKNATINGFDFVPPVTVWLQCYGTAQSPASATIRFGTEVVVAPSGNSITATFDLNGVATGGWDLLVRNPNGKVGFATGALRILDLSPVCSFIIPAVATPGMVLSDAVVVGKWFDRRATVSLTRTGEPSIPGTGVTVASDGMSLKVGFDLTSCATGPWNLVVRNPSGEVGSISNALNVKFPAPYVTGSFPTSGPNTGVLTGLKVYGYNFRPGLKLLFFNAEDRLATDIVVAADGKSLTCSIDLTGLFPVHCMLILENPDGQQSPSAPQFTITGGN